MKALVLREEMEAVASLVQTLSAKGFQVLCVESRHTARAMLRLETIDLLIMDEQIRGALTHAVALSAERANPYINQILLTDRPGFETDDLFDLIPSLYCLAGRATPPVLLTQLAMSSIESFEQAKQRVTNIVTRFDQEDATPPEEDDFVIPTAPVITHSQGLGDGPRWTPKVTEAGALLSSADAVAAPSARISVPVATVQMPTSAVRISHLSAVRRHRFSLIDS